MGTIIVNKISSKARHWQAQKRGEGRANVGGTEGIGIVGGTSDEKRSPVEEVEAKEDEGRLYDALDKLPQARRELLVKYHISKLSLSELAEELECSQEAVHQRILRAEEALESALKGLDQTRR